MIEISQAIKWVKPRLSRKRFAHVGGVAEVGVKLSELIGLDAYSVELACWLHDACKEMKDRQLIEMAEAAGRKLSQDERENGHLLHGPMAAVLAREELGVQNTDVLAAIAEHTIGALNMSAVSKVVYLADKLEPSRPAEFTAPIWQALGVIPLEPGPAKTRTDNRIPQSINLDRAIFVAMNLTLAKLIRKEKHIQTTAVEIRNHFLDSLR
jgi:predicted HD superfamily hydrolase involved in NAD metabolism